MSVSEPGEFNPEVPTILFVVLQDVIIAV
jgi:hypothetical protein